MTPKVAGMRVVAPRRRRPRRAGRGRVRVPFSGRLRQGALLLLAAWSLLGAVDPAAGQEQTPTPGAGRAVGGLSALHARFRAHGQADRDHDRSSQRERSGGRLGHRPWLAHGHSCLPAWSLRHAGWRCSGRSGVTAQGGTAGRAASTAASCRTRATVIDLWLTAAPVCPTAVPGCRSSCSPIGRGRGRDAPPGSRSRGSRLRDSLLSRRRARAPRPPRRSRGRLETCQPAARREARCRPTKRHSWRAEVSWNETEAGAHFSVIARTDGQEQARVIAESPSLEWPPTSPAAVRALNVAVAELERRLLAAGWTPLSAGPEWYAKRFAWIPPVAPAAERSSPAQLRPPDSVRRAAEATPRAVAESPAKQERAGRFRRRPAWPEGTDQLWRCEIRWDAGLVNSRFAAVAFEAGERRGRAIGDSATFKWLMMSDPDPGAEEYLKELRRLTASLKAAGWEFVGRGPKWYSARFVWRRTATPPGRIELPAPRASQAR